MTTDSFGIKKHFLKENLKMKKTALVVLLALVCVLSVFAQSQTETAAASKFPEKQVTMIIPKGAGGSHDAHAQIIVKFAEKYLGKPLIAQLMPGGSGSIGANYVKSSIPDGYTILFGDNGVNTVLPITQDVGYGLDDFIPIARINYSATVIVAKPGVWKDFNEFVEYAKAHPGEISYASSGLFNAGHNAFEVMQKATGITLNHVPMQGGADPQMQVLGGHVPLCGAFLDEVIDFIETGELQALAVMAHARLAEIPEVPTLIELGYGENAVWEMHRTMFAPKGTPEEAIRVLEAAFKGICEDPEFIELINKMGEGVYFMGSDDMMEYWQNEAKQFEAIFNSSAQ